MDFTEFTPLPIYEFLLDACRAVEGCTYVIHTASPLGTDGQNSNRQLMVDLPREGAKRVFKAIEEAGCIKRVVVTSSISACKSKSSFLFSGCFYAKNHGCSELVRLAHMHACTDTH